MLGLFLQCILPSRSLYYCCTHVYFFSLQRGRPQGTPAPLPRALQPRPPKRREKGHALPTPPGAEELVLFYFIFCFVGPASCLLNEGVICYFILRCAAGTYLSAKLTPAVGAVAGGRAGGLPGRVRFVPWFSSSAIDCQSQSIMRSPFLSTPALAV